MKIILVQISKVNQDRDQNKEIEVQVEEETRH